MKNGEISYDLKREQPPLQRTSEPILPAPANVPGPGCELRSRMNGPGLLLGLHSVVDQDTEASGIFPLKSKL